MFLIMLVLVVSTTTVLVLLLHLQYNIGYVYDPSLRFWLNEATIHLGTFGLRMYAMLYNERIIFILKYFKHQTSK